MHLETLDAVCQMAVSVLMNFSSWHWSSSNKIWWSCRRHFVLYFYLRAAAAEVIHTHTHTGEFLHLECPFCDCQLLSSVGKLTDFQTHPAVCSCDILRSKSLQFNLKIIQLTVKEDRTGSAVTVPSICLSNVQMHLSDIMRLSPFTIRYCCDRSDCCLIFLADYINVILDDIVKLLLCYFLLSVVGLYHSDISPDIDYLGRSGIG